MKQNNPQCGRYKLQTLLLSSLMAMPVAGQVIDQDSNDSSIALEEIIVTAQKRVENIQDVGITINAFTAHDIDSLNVDSAVELSRQVPNLEATNTFGRSNPVYAIRGVGFNDYNANNNPTVGLYVNEVVLVSNAMLGFQLFDLERVEVLKGPQGILFGRNTTGGAVSFHTAKPEGEAKGRFKVSYGRFDRFDIDGMINVPLTDTLVVRVSGQTTQQGKGFASNRVTDKNIGEIDVWSLRGQIGWSGVNTNINLNAHGSRERSDSLAYEHLGHADIHAGIRGGTSLAAGKTAYLDRCDAFLAGRRDRANCVDVVGYNDNDGDPYSVDHNISPIIHSDAWGFSATVNHDFDGVSLASITGYENLDRTQTSDADASPFRIDDFSEDANISQFSQELRLASNGEGIVDWVLGVFYLEDHVKTDAFIDSIDDPRVLFSGGYPKTVDQDSKSSAGFVQLEWHVMENLDLIGGIRATREQRSYVGGTSYTLAHVGIDFDLPLTFTDAKIDPKTGITYRFGLEYKVNDDVLLYANASKGIKSGGISGGFTFSQEELMPFKQEKLFAYEAGIKSRLANNRIHLNMAGFYYDYKDVQIFAVSGNGRTNALQNSDKARVYGIEVDITWLPAEGFMISGGLGLLDTKLKSLDAVINDTPVTLRGLELANAPGWTINALMSYETYISESFRVMATFDIRAQGAQFRDAFNQGHIKEGAYTLANASVAILPASEDWKFSIWAKNLFDKHYSIYAFPVDAYRQTLIIPNEPVTYGISLEYDF